MRSSGTRLNTDFALAFGPVSIYAIALLWTVLRAGLPILWADDITRSMWAVIWANDPFFFPSDLVWLPAPMWLDGIAVWLGGNAWEPIFVVNGLCGAVVVLMVIAIAREARLGGALIVGMLAALSPVLVIVSASRLSEPKAWAFEMTGLYFWQRYISTRRPLAYTTAFLFLSLAALSRYELWIIPGALAIYGLVSRFRRGDPPLWVAVGAALPLSLAISTLIFLNLTRFGAPLYGRFAQDGDGASRAVPPFLERLSTLSSEVWPYVAPQLALALVGCGLALRRGFPAIRWLPFLTGALTGLLAFGALLQSSGTAGFNARLIGGGLLPLLPFIGLPLQWLQERFQRLPVAAVTLLVALGWFLAVPGSTMRVDDLRLATMVALSWRQVSGLAVQEGSGSRLVEYAARTVLPFPIPSAHFRADAPYPAWVPRSLPAGQEVLVISRRDADLGLTSDNSLQILAGTHLMFSIICPPAPSYEVPMTAQGVPTQVAPGQRFTVTVSVRNTTSFPWRSTGPCPVLGAWAWDTGSERGAPARFPLPRDLLPGEAASWPVEIQAPAVAKRYRLRLTLVQERSAWFDAQPGFQPPMYEVDVR